MTEENVQEMQDQALGQYTRLLQTLTATKTRMAKTAQEMASVGDDLQNRREWAGFIFNPCPWLNQEYVKNVAQDIVTAEREVQEAKSKAISLGVAVTD